MRRLLILGLVLTAPVACDRAGRPSASPDAAIPTIDPPAVHTISGIVRERHAPHFVPVQNAVVTVSAGPQAGRTATTDGSGRYLFEWMRADPVSLRVVAAGFEEATTAATPGQPTPDILLSAQTITLQWAARADTIATRIPFTVAHWGPATLTISANAWHCGTYGYFDASIRVQGRSVAYVGLCQPGTSSQSAMLSPGTYELLIEMLPFSTGAHQVRVDHPR